MVARATLRIFRILALNLEAHALVCGINSALKLQYLEILCARPPSVSASLHLCLMQTTMSAYAHCQDKTH
jgi:hypothetical protein